MQSSDSIVCPRCRCNFAGTDRYDGIPAGVLAYADDLPPRFVPFGKQMHVAPCRLSGGADHPAATDDGRPYGKCGEDRGGRGTIYVPEPPRHGDPIYCGGYLCGFVWGDCRPPVDNVVTWNLQLWARRSWAPPAEAEVPA